MKSILGRSLGLLLLISGSAASATESDWTYDAFYNPVAESRTFFARVDADGSSLELRCSARDPNTQLRLRTPFANRSRDVGVNFDDQESRQMEWIPSVNGHSLRLSTQHLKDFSRGLRAHNVLTVDLAQDNAESRSIEFSLRGSAKAIANLRKHCRFI